MPSLAQDYREDDLTVDTPTVCELMDKFYQLYVAMAHDPCLEDLAADVAELINELDARRELARQIAVEEEHNHMGEVLH